MKKRKFISFLMLTLVLFTFSFNFFSKFNMSKVEAVAGVDDLAMLALVSAVVGSTGYVVSNQAGLESLSNSIDRYINDNFDKDSPTFKERASVAATQIGGSIALDSVKNLVSLINDFSSSNRYSNVVYNTIDGINYDTMTQADVFNHYGFIRCRSSSSNKIDEFNSNLSSYSFSGSILLRPNDREKSDYGNASELAYVLYAFDGDASYNNKPSASYIRKTNDYYDVPCYSRKFWICKDDLYGGYRTSGAGTVTSTHIFELDRVVSIDTGDFDFWDNTVEVSGYRDYYPVNTRYVGDGVARSLSPSIPVTKNTITNIYENSVSSDTSSDDALLKAIEALDNNSQVADANLSSILNQYLATIIQKIDNLALTISSFSADGSAALELDGDAWNVIEGGGSDNDNDNKHNKWISLAFLAPLIWIGEDLLTQSGATDDIIDSFKDSANEHFINLENGLNNIINFFSEVIEDIKALPEAIFNVFKDFLQECKEALDNILNSIYSTLMDILDTLELGFNVLVDYVAQILTALQTLPQALSDVLTDAFADIKVEAVALDVPDVVVEPVIELNPEIEVNPSLDLLLNPLSRIIEILEQILIGVDSFFEIDTVAIAQAWDAAIDYVGFNFSKYTAPFAMLANHKFDNEPPVISIETPQILHFVGFSDAEIILFDASKFNNYFVVIRSLVKAFIIIAYAYACLNKFKVRFSM